MFIKKWAGVLLVGNYNLMAQLILRMCETTNLLVTQLRVFWLGMSFVLKDTYYRFGKPFNSCFWDLSPSILSLS